MKFNEQQNENRPKINRNWKHFLRTEQPRPMRTQSKVQTVCKLRKGFQHRRLVLVDLELRFERDTFGFVLDQCYRPPRGETSDWNFSIFE